ncbi:MAG: response regulator [Enterococcus sp.]|nr:response regulator [Enterococcus sp.]
MKIWICDDEQRTADQFRDWMIEAAENEGILVDVHIFSCGEELLTIAETELSEVSFIILDIEMLGIDGIETAQLLRDERSYQGELLFLTNHSQVLADSLNLGTTRRLQKTITKEEFQILILRLLKRAEQMQAKISLEVVEEGKRCFLIQEIIYFFMTGFGKRKKMWMKTTKGSYQINELFDGLDQRLRANGFFRIADQGIVSLSNIQSLQSGSITMSDGSKVKINRRTKEELTARLFTVLGET